MIVAAAMIPHPPLLLPGITGSSDAQVETITRFATAAVAATVDSGIDDIIGIGGAATTAQWPAGVPATAGYLGRSASGNRLPLSLSVITSLLPERRGWPLHLRSIAFDATAAQAREFGSSLADGPGRTALVVAGDGSARRTANAPGFVDVRAVDYDRAVERALAEADTEALARLDPVQARELLVAGRAAWQVLAGACHGQRFESHIDYTGDPFGVWYVVARWRNRCPGPMLTRI